METLDVTHLTRNSDLVKTRIKAGFEQEEVILCGEAGIDSLENDYRSYFRSYAREGATDFEHDSSYILKFPIIGVEPKVISSTFSSYEAWLQPGSVKDFAVPDPDYSPFEDPQLCSDQRCQEEHPIIDYTPEQTEYARNLYRRLVGNKLIIEWRIRNE